ncbi:MAG TPA: hypothetical protein VFX06_12305 [Stellaceae bacterium]|nr:hypothetical protein [Stellaceae bacterium]
MSGTVSVSACLSARLDASTILHNYGDLRDSCDFIVDDGQGVPPHIARQPRPIDAFIQEIDRVRDGAVVCVRTNLVDGFFATAFPRLRASIVLVTIGSDWSTPGRHARHLYDARVLRWFGQNCDLSVPHPKFEPLPLGFAEPHWPHGDQSILLRIHPRMPAVEDKPLKAYATFHLTLSHPERRRVWRQIRDLPDIKLEQHRISPELLWIRHAGYAFEICPRGAGPDCHRIWEALLLRTIPIVQRSPLAPLFRGLPVVLVDDWRAVTPEHMAAWRSRFADRFTAEMFESLTAPYWIARVAEAAARHLPDDRKPAREPIS